MWAGINDLIGIVKRLLDALKGETITEEMLPNFTAPFESLIKCQFSGEVHRAMALFITYTFHSATVLHAGTPRTSNSASRSSTPAPKIPVIDAAAANVFMPSRNLGKRQLGKIVLELYSRLLLDPGTKANIEKFARTVTNKVTGTPVRNNRTQVLIPIQWLLYLLSDPDPDIILHGARILARLLVTHGNSYVKKFRHQAGGFHVMAHRLKRWWGVRALWPTCFSLLFGLDVARSGLDPEDDSSSWVAAFSNRKVMYPETLPVIIGMLHHGLKDILKYQDDPESPSCEKMNPPISRHRARSSGSLLDLEQGKLACGVTWLHESLLTCAI